MLINHSPRMFLDLFRSRFLITPVYECCVVTMKWYVDGKDGMDECSLSYERKRLGIG